MYEIYLLCVAAKHPTSLIFLKNGKRSKQKKFDTSLEKIHSSDSLQNVLAKGNTQRVCLIVYIT